MKKLQPTAGRENKSQVGREKKGWTNSIQPHMSSRQEKIKPFRSTHDISKANPMAFNHVVTLLVVAEWWLLPVQDTWADELCNQGHRKSEEKSVNSPTPPLIFQCALRPLYLFLVKQPPPPIDLFVFICFSFIYRCSCLLHIKGKVYVVWHSTTVWEDTGLCYVSTRDHSVKRGSFWLTRSFKMM